jgi:hypothetical protein
MYAYVPAMVIRRAPVKTPFGLNVAARFRKLFVGSPSSKVSTPGRFAFKSGSPMTIKPSSASVT